MARCPVFFCGRVLNNNQSLKSHISRVHKELEDAGIDFSQSKIKWPQTLIDHVMRVYTCQKKYFVNQVLKPHIDKFAVKELDRALNGAQNGLQNGN